MSNIINKIKEIFMGSTNKTTSKAKDLLHGTNMKDKHSTARRDFEEGAAGTPPSIQEDPLKEFREKEAMTPAKINEHEATAVRREMTEKIVEPGQEKVNPEEAAERARRSGMTKGTAGAGETGSTYEQGAAGSNK